MLWTYVKYFIEAAVKMTEKGVKFAEDLEKPIGGADDAAQRTAGGQSILKKQDIFDMGGLGGGDKQNAGGGAQDYAYVTDEEDTTEPFYS